MLFVLTDLMFWTHSNASIFIFENCFYIKKLTLLSPEYIAVGGSRDALHLDNGVQF